MNKTELIELLESIAAGDTADDANIADHPCSVAVRALNQCFEDINTLRRTVHVKSSSKMLTTLRTMKYKPEW